MTGETQQIPGVSSIVTLKDQYTAGNRGSCGHMAAPPKPGMVSSGTGDFVNNYQYSLNEVNNLYGQVSQVTQSGQAGGDSVTAKPWTSAITTTASSTPSRATITPATRSSRATTVTTTPAA